MDELLEGRPLARRAADLAETAAAAGELVRRLRTSRGMSQADLAARIGSTQAHLSELERGLGANGPTVATLARIVQEFGDDLVIDTKHESERREAELMVAARSSVGDITVGLMTDLLRQGPAAMAREWPEVFAKAGENPFAKMLTEGMLAGIYMALQWLGLPNSSRNEIRSVLLRSIEKPALEGRQELAAQLVDRLGRG
ncbi:MAG TPA: helix-turn-helix transcriptional regulator [Stellaceae bacterium]|nr:helix-turn-helix transcriptional regulator [Stellaceae bacterium]